MQSVCQFFVIRDSRLAHLCNPDDPFLSLGMCEVKRGNYLAARKLFAIAARQSEHVDTWLNLCTAAVLTGDWQEAERACQFVLDRYPNHAAANIYMERIKKREAPQERVAIVKGEYPSSERG